jgi:hypothetical protein
MHLQCDHARRLHLKKLSCLRQSLVEVPTDFLNHFWIQVMASLLQPPNGGFRSETAVTRRFRKQNGQKFSSYVFNGHSPTDKIVRSGVTVM